MMFQNTIFFVTLALIGVFSILSGAAADCGQRNPDGVMDEKNDVEDQAEFGEFPWMVLIFRDEEQDDGRFRHYPCGGSLIHPKVVLTSIACAQSHPKNINDMTVRAGEWKLSENEYYYHQTRHVVEIITHENYTAAGTVGQNPANDIAILILNEEFHQNITVGVICLPPHGPEAPEGTCIATGFGLDTNHRAPDIMKRLSLPIVDRDTCTKNLRLKSPGLVIEDSFICAGGEFMKDMCNGDSGSPLVCLVPGKSNQYMQSGIVSFGAGCGQENMPGVYSNVAYLRPWIDEQLSRKKINMTPYAM